MVIVWFLNNVNGVSELTKCYWLNCIARGDSLPELLISRGDFDSSFTALEGDIYLNPARVPPSYNGASGF